MLATKTDSLGRSQRWRMTLSSAIEEFIEKGVRSTATATAYRSDLKLFLRWLAGRAGSGYDSVTKFTHEYLTDYLTELKHHRSAGTQHRRLAAFRKFAKWGQRNGLWKGDPTERLESIPKPTRLPTPFSDDEVMRLRALDLPATENVLRAVLLYSGLRATAAARIRVKDVTASPPRIAYVAKGGREKSVPMKAALKSILWDYIATHTDMEGESHIFTKPTRGTPYDRDYLRDITARWGKAAKVPDCRPHRFRHTFATKLLEKTGNLRAVQEALGHDDIGSTVVYTRVVSRDLEDAVNQVSWGPDNPTEETR